MLPEYVTTSVCVPATKPTGKVKLAVPTDSVAVPRAVAPSVSDAVPSAGRPGELIVTETFAAVPYGAVTLVAATVGAIGVIAGITSCRVASTLPAESVDRKATVWSLNSGVTGNGPVYDVQLPSPI